MSILSAIEREFFADGSGDRGPLAALETADDWRFASHRLELCSADGALQVSAAPDGRVTGPSAWLN